MCLFKQGAKTGTVRKLDILLGKIEFKFKKRSDLQQGRAEMAQLSRISAAQLVHRNPVLDLRRRRDHISNSLSLCKIHLSIEKSTSGELSGHSKPGTRSLKKGKQGRDYITGRMAGNLHRILTGVRMRRTENTDKHLVQHISVMVQYSSEPQPITIRLPERFSGNGNDPAGNPHGIRSAEPDNGNGPGAWHCGRSAYRIIKKTEHSL